MRLTWEVEEKDIKTIKDLIKISESNQFVKNRYKKNILGDGIEKTNEAFWNALISCLLTTRQKSGYASPVSKLLHDPKKPLSLVKCQAQKDLSKYVIEILSNSKGIRRYNKIADQTHKNLEFLNNSSWSIVKEVFDELPTKSSSKELKIIQKVTEFKGIGQKQSRNLLQMLGLTKYEIPIDSRLNKWINKNLDFPVKLSAKGLQDPSYYSLLIEGIKKLADSVGCYPCEIDAMIFSSFEKK